VCAKMRLDAISGLMTGVNYEWSIRSQRRVNWLTCTLHL